MRQLPPRTLDEHGDRYIRAREAFRGRLYRDGSVEQDGTPRWAIGYGHTCSRMEVDGYHGVELSVDEATFLFRMDMIPRVEAINRSIKVEVSQHEFDALASVAFNIGTGALAKSDILRCLNSGDYAGACSHFMDWVYWHAAPGAPLTKSDGLVVRRTLDQQLFRLRDDDEVEFEALLERVSRHQIDLTAELASLQPGRHIMDEEPDTGGPL